MSSVQVVTGKVCNRRAVLKNRGVVIDKSLYLFLLWCWKGVNAFDDSIIRSVFVGSWLSGPSDAPSSASSSGSAITTACTCIWSGV